jgi:hypothetical protein
MENLTKKNFFAYAMLMYNNPSCSGLEEFEEDLLRIKYIKRLLHRYTRTGEISPRLLLNHLIGLCNVFRPEAIARMLFLRIDSKSWSALKTVLVYINLMPDVVPTINGQLIESTNVVHDQILLKLLESSVECA